jgi:hypothetical protein
VNWLKDSHEQDNPLSEETTFTMLAAHKTHEIPA